MSSIPCNDEKNRFLNIFPCKFWKQAARKQGSLFCTQSQTCRTHADDYNRVKLKEIEDVEGSDYINASYLNVNWYSNKVLYINYIMNNIIMQGYYKQKAYIAAQGKQWKLYEHDQKLTQYHGVYICRSPAKFVGGFLENDLGTEATNNRDAYEMLRRESKLSNSCYSSCISQTCLCYCLSRKSASVTGLITRTTHSLLVMISPSPSQAQFPSLILSSENDDQKCMYLATCCLI